MKSLTRWQWILLLLILVIGSSIRFYNISNIGLKHVDEATYLLEGQWMNGVDYAKMPYKLTGSKPLHSYLISLNLGMFGNVDYAGILVAAIAGSLTLAVVFLIGYYAYSFNIGIIATAILAFNKLHIVFSRSGYAESLMMLFFSLALLFYILSLKNKKRFFYLVLAGICIGLSYDAKFLGAFMLILIFVNELISIFLYRRNIKDAAVNFSVLFAGFLLVFFVTWFFYFLAGQSYLFYFLHRIDQIQIGHMILNSLPYIRDIPKYPCDWVSGGNILFESIAYIFYMYKTFTVFVLIVTGLGFLKMTMRRKKMDVLFLSIFILTTLFVIMIAYGRPRTIMFFPVLIAILGGIGAVRVARFLPRKWGLIVIVFILALSGAIKSLDAISYENQSFKEASEYVVDLGANETVSTNWQVIAFYTELYSTNICNAEGYVIIDTWKLQMYPNDHCLWQIYNTQKPINRVPHTVEAWRFPIRELELFRHVGLHKKLESLFVTHKTDYELLVYGPQ